MGFIVEIFNTVFFEPLTNALVFLIGVMPFHDIGLATIVLTLVVRFIIFPLNHRSIKTQIKMKELEPEIKKIKERIQKNSQEQARRIMELYRAHGINPFSGFVTLLVQIPIIIALFKVFSTGINIDSSILYSFVSAPEAINSKFLGFIEMGEKSYILGALTGITQFFQMRLAVPPIKKEAGEKSFKSDFARNMNIQMRYVLPVFIFFIASRFSAALALYWTTMNVFAIVHESFVRRKAKKI